MMDALFVAAPDLVIGEPGQVSAVDDEMGWTTVRYSGGVSKS